MTKREGRTIDLQERFPDRRVYWAVQTCAAGVGALVFLTARADGSTPLFFVGFLAIAGALSWFYFKIGVLSRRGFEVGYFRLEPSLWRFWFGPPSGPERTPSAWILWIVSCVTAALYFAALLRAMFLTLS